MTDAPTILVVDDERGPRESLRMILAPHYHVLQAQSGSEALDVLGKRPVDVVTLDLNMPGMMGPRVMRSIRHEHPRIEIIIITGCGSIETATEGIRYGICDYLQKPFDVVQVMAAVTRAMARRRSRSRLVSFLEELGTLVGRERDARAILEDLQRNEQMRGRLAVLLGECGEEIQLGGLPTDPGRTVKFLEVLAETIETKDRFMRGHASRVAFYASLVAERLDLSRDQREEVRIAAFLHDLGKVGVPTDLLLRPGALEPSERKIVEQHPAIGARLLEPLDIGPGVATAIRHHHEWWDGTGYPDGLSGEEIPLTSRIIGVVDAFDAMSSDRPYRQSLMRGVVTRELERFAGVQFDPEIAKEFLALLESGLEELDLMAAAASTCQVGSAGHEASALR